MRTLACLHNPNRLQQTLTRRTNETLPEIFWPTNTASEIQQMTIIPKTLNGTISWSRLGATIGIIAEETTMMPKTTNACRDLPTRSFFTNSLEVIMV
jgi:hypothetical protein